MGTANISIRTTLTDTAGTSYVNVMSVTHSSATFYGKQARITTSTNFTSFSANAPPRYILVMPDTTNTMSFHISQDTVDLGLRFSSQGPNLLPIVLSLLPFVGLVVYSTELTTSYVNWREL
jgi:hypothetical protein